MLVRGRGEAYLYTGKDGGGKYLPPSVVQNSLVQNGDGTWTETQPDNLKFVYDTSGNLSRLVSPAGGRWTVIRSSGLMTALSGPFSRRTTFAYDGSNKLKRFQDPGGRITTFLLIAECKLLRDLNSRQAFPVVRGNRGSNPANGKSIEAVQITFPQEASRCRR